jgi:GT2 family glycosyltransferase
MATQELLSYLSERIERKSDINEHLGFLYTLVVESGAQKIVELGTRGGDSTCAFLIGAFVTGGHVVSVDHGKGTEYTQEPSTSDRLSQTSAFVKNKLGLSDLWTLVVRDDAEFASEYSDEIDLLFIDTIHSYEQTRIELEKWGSKVVDGAFILLHDTVSYPEQNKAIWEFLDKNPLSQYVEHKNCNGLGIIIKNTGRPQETYIPNRHKMALGTWEARVDRLQEGILEMRARLQLETRARRQRIEEPKDPLGKLLLLFQTRPDLQSTFPEVNSGDYSRLLDWAAHAAVSGSDTASEYLTKDSEWYEQNPWQKIVELDRKLSRLQSELARFEGENAALQSELARFEGENAALQSELASQRRRLSELESELHAIRRSFGYKWMRFWASIVDRLFPDGTSRGNLRKTVIRSLQLLTDEGPKSFLRQAVQKSSHGELGIVSPPNLSPDILYAAWVTANTPDKACLRAAISDLPYKPKISIVMPVFNADPKFLRQAIDSVTLQPYAEWELCICDDASTNPDTNEVLDEKRWNDRRIKITNNPINMGIAAASNSALALATGDFVGFLDQDDLLYPDALFEVAKLINEQPDLDYLYSDEDKIDERGVRTEPFFKPDWSPDLLLSVNYVNHFSVYRTGLLRSIDGFRQGYEGSQDYDLVLRASDRTQKIGHVRKAIYGWRISSSSTAGSETAKPMAHSSAIMAIEDAMRRHGIEAQVQMQLISGYSYRYRVKYAIIDRPLISVLIPARTTKYVHNCVKSILKKTSYENYEIIVVDNSASGEVSSGLPATDKIKVIRYTSDYNFSALNNEAAKAARGRYVVFLNDDTEIISEEWLSAMLEHAQREEIGAVGARLLYPDGMVVQHAGIIIGISGYAANYGGMVNSDPGYFAFAEMVRNCAAVTAACMMVRKSYFLELGGFDESLGHSWNDVDFGIRVLQSGRRVTYTPFAVLYHHEGGSRGRHDASKQEASARELFRRKNLDFITSGDPYYNPNLSLEIPYQIRADSFLPLLSDPKLALQTLYTSRPDLKKAFPEAEKGDLSKLMAWAADTRPGTDSAAPLLLKHRNYFVAKSRRPSSTRKRGPGREG